MPDIRFEGHPPKAGFADCKEVAIALSGTLPGSVIAYGVYCPLTDPETWHEGWRRPRLIEYPAFSHFWVEYEGRIIDNAAAQFGESNHVVVPKSDPRYIRVGRYDIEYNECLPEVDDPTLVWSTYSGPGGFVHIIWNEYPEYVVKLRDGTGTGTMPLPIPPPRPPPVPRPPAPAPDPT